MGYIYISARVSEEVAEEIEKMRRTALGTLPKSIVAGKLIEIGLKHKEELELEVSA